MLLISAALFYWSGGHMDYASLQAVNGLLALLIWWLPSRLPPRQAPPPPQAAHSRAPRHPRPPPRSWPTLPAPLWTKLALVGGLLFCALVSHLARSPVVATVQLAIALLTALVLCIAEWVPGSLRCLWADACNPLAC